MKLTIVYSLLAAVLLLCLLDGTYSQFNPQCRGKRYMCDNHGVINVTNQCMYINDTKNKLHLLKPCTNPDKPICDYSAISYGNPAYCVADTTPVELTLPGEYCSRNAQCLSGVCKGTCRGKSAGTVCASDSECDVGMFCSATYKVCTKQQLFGQVYTSEI